MCLVVHDHLGALQIKLRCLLSRSALWVDARVSRIVEGGSLSYVFRTLILKIFHKRLHVWDYAGR